jgi:hypothetical protein
MNITDSNHPCKVASLECVHLKRLHLSGICSLHGETLSRFLHNCASTLTILNLGSHTTIRNLRTNARTAMLVHSNLLPRSS